jgi:dTDP-glucose 4,6-dehydratase
MAEGLLRLLRSPHPGPVNIGNPVELSVLDIAKRIVELCGSDSEIVFVERPTDDPTVRQPDISLAKELLGWEPVVTIDDGLKRTIDWFHTHPEVYA